ncbi:MAG: hypothetical protein WD696_09055 [Bryobacteraceae bacterium]
MLLKPIIALVVAALLQFSACSRRDDPGVLVEEEPPVLASTLHVADPRARTQLLKGWHEVEQGSWRWTAGKFAVLLRPPRNAAENGATLQLKFSVPEAVIARLQSVTLSADVQGFQTQPQTYKEAGQFVYSQDIEGKLLTGDSVTVSFGLDKWLPPGNVDQRELGLIVSTVGFEAK